MAHSLDRLSKPSGWVLNNDNDFHVNHIIWIVLAGIRVRSVCVFVSLCSLLNLCQNGSILFVNLMKWIKFSKFWCTSSKVEYRIRTWYNRLFSSIFRHYWAWDHQIYRFYSHLCIVRAQHLTHQFCQSLQLLEGNYLLENNIW